MALELAVIGDRETVTGMALAGAAHTHTHRDRDETLSRLGEFLSSEGIGLVMITHRVAEELGEDFRRIMRTKRLLPLVLRIPDRRGYEPKSDELRQMVKRTVGAEIVVKRKGE